MKMTTLVHQTIFVVTDMTVMGGPVPQPIPLFGDRYSGIMEDITVSLLTVTLCLAANSLKCHSSSMVYKWSCELLF